MKEDCYVTLVGALGIALAAVLTAVAALVRAVQVSGAERWLRWRVDQIDRQLREMGKPAANGGPPPAE